MDRLRLLAAYDRELRRDAVLGDTRREEHRDLVTHTSLVGGAGCVLYAPLAPGGVGDRVRDEIAYFESIGQDFDWVCFEHDPGAGLLGALLPRLGLEPGPPRPVWVRAVEGDLPEPGAGVEVRGVRDEDEADQVLAVQERVRGRGLLDLGLRLRETVRTGSRAWTAFLATVDGTPAGSGWSVYDGPRFGALAGGGVLPARRGRGVYRALLGARIRAAAERGASYVVVTPGPGRDRLLERWGFRPLTAFARYRYRVSRPI